MTDLELHSKTDRELLLLAVLKLNETCRAVERHERILEGNGKPGIKAQVRWMWLIFGGAWAIFLVYLKR